MTNCKECAAGPKDSEKVLVHVERTGRQPDHYLVRRAALAKYGEPIECERHIFGPDPDCDDCSQELREPT